MEAPLLYLSLEPRPADGTTRPLLDDLLGPEGLLARLGDRGAASAVRVLHTFLARSDEAMELALVGLLPRPGADRPLLIFRGRLTGDDAAAMAALLASGSATRPARRIGAHRVHRFIGGAEDQVGGAVEVVLAGRDLLVANAATALDEILADPGATTTRRTLEADPVHRRLRALLPRLPGSVSLYARGSHMLRRLPGPDGRWLRRTLDTSGLLASRGMILRLEPRASGTVAEAVIDLGADGVPPGLFQLLRPARLQDLVADLPRGGLARAVVAVDPLDLVDPRRAGPRVGIMVHALTDGCAGMGLDFEHQVLRRLGERAALQTLLLEETDQLHLAWSLAARNRRAAGQLFDDLRRALQIADAGTFHDGQRRRPDTLEVRGLFGGAPAWLAVVDDSLVLGDRREVVEQAWHAARAADRPKASELLSLFRELEIDRRTEVLGLFAVEAAPLLKRWLGTDAGALPARQVGAMQVEGGVLRLRMFSPR